MYLSEKAMETHSSTLVWKIPWTEELGKPGYDGWEGSRAEDKALSVSGLRRF